MRDLQRDRDVVRGGIGMIAHVSKIYESMLEDAKIQIDAARPRRSGEPELDTAVRAIEAAMEHLEWARQVAIATDKFQKTFMNLLGAFTEPNA